MPQLIDALLAESKPLVQPSLFPVGISVCDASEYSDYSDSHHTDGGGYNDSHSDMGGHTDNWGDSHDQ